MTKRDHILRVLEPLDSTIAQAICNIVMTWTLNVYMYTVARSCKNCKVEYV